ncbi:MAG: type IX secretion system sortase PorU [Mangrovibacterium sp.]
MLMTKFVPVLILLMWLITPATLGQKRVLDWATESGPENPQRFVYSEVSKKQKSWHSSSVLATGKWVQLKAAERGIYKITYSQLRNLGLEPAQVCLYGNGGFMLPKMNDEDFFDDLVQNPVWHGKDKNNNDCLFFYATGTIRWTYYKSSGAFKHQRNEYADYACYYLSDQGEPRLVESSPAETGEVTHEVASFLDYRLYEEEKENLIHSGSRWFGDRFQDGQTRNYSFVLENVDSSRPVTVYVEGAGRSAGSSSLTVSSDQGLHAKLDFQAVQTGDPIGPYASTNQTRFQLDGAASDLSLNLLYQASGNSAIGWLDYIEVNFFRALAVGNTPLFFRDTERIGSGSVPLFEINSPGNNLQVWEVTDFVGPKSVPYEQTGSLVQFLATSDMLREFVAFYPDGDIPEPEIVGEVPNQNLHQAIVPDMIIITHPDFLSGADELANFHRQSDQLSVVVVTPEHIYNEFSGGLPDAAGIRNYLRMCYDRSNAGGGNLKYVLLLGDGSYDNRNLLGKGYNFIPTYQSENSLLPTASFVTDDFFVLLDPGEGDYVGNIDLGIGRIPARTMDEVTAVVQKIKNYASTNSLGNWRNVVCFIGDDEDANTHMAQSESLADAVNLTNPALSADKIYFDAWPEKATPAGDQYPGVNEAINKRVKEGALILNYIGHANELALAHEKVLGINDIDQWQNFDRLPVFVTATCEISRFDGDENSGGEHILFNPHGGGIGLFSTTRVVYSNPNFILNSEFYKHIFSRDEGGKTLALGEVMKRTKNGINTGTNKRNFTLLGDPAIRLALPNYQVVTKTINGHPPGEMTEPIGPLSNVTVTGEIIDEAGNSLPDFNGEIIPVVYDKQDTVKTLGNGGNDPFTYKVRNNIIFKGMATVTYGRFSFSLVVPKDVSYAVSPGMISYYANNGQVDANGYSDGFLIGGPSGNVANDVVGPDIRLYLNDEGFRSGDEVGKNPVLYVRIEDETGINTVGTGIGHDITAVIDGDNSHVLVLNDYFLSDMDSHTSGSLVYPLTGLSAGEHTLRLKVWDVLNNSAEVEITFRITDALEIEEVICYPNPLSDFTNFKFKHNRPDETLDARVEIYDYSGSMLDVIKERLRSTGNESLPMVWQVSDSQVLVRSGAYLYRIVVVAPDGATTSKTGRMIILRQ